MKINAIILTASLLFPYQAFADYGCRSHYSERYHRVITRCSSTVAEFKKMHPCPSTGAIRGACPGWVVDHIIALCVGGEDAVHNLQWQTVEDAKAKDRWECQ
jgi:hypothetical protein